MKPSYIKLVGPVASLMLIAGNVLAQNTGGNSQGQQIAALQVAVSNLQATVTTLQTTVTGLQVANSTLQAMVKVQQFAITSQQNTITDLGSLLQYVSLDGQDMYITGANLHIVSGSSATDGAVNGLGNLIVGYNELRPHGGDNRTGSHNIVVGAQQNFSSFGGLVAGQFNTISGPYASVSGGSGNTASGPNASVCGGDRTKPAAQLPRSAGGKTTRPAEDIAP